MSASIVQAKTAAILSEPTATKEYEELDGKAGVNALYRPDRYRLRDLVENPKLFTLHVNERVVRPRNFSITGLSFEDEARTEWPIGTNARYVFALGGKPILEGDATVARVGFVDTEASRAIEVGLIATEMLDYESLRTAEQNHLWEQGLQRQRCVFRDSVPSAYREAILELGAFCQYYKNLLGRREIQHPGDSLAIAHETVPVIEPGWNQHLRNAATTAREFLKDRRTLDEARLMTEALVTAYMVEAPALRRAFTKPLGYPGDYALMQYYYDNGFEGDSAFGLALHKIGNAHPLAVGVRTRSQWVAEHIRERAAQQTSATPLHVLSLGCGVGAEVAMVQSSTAGPSVPIEWLLIDQEDEALAVAYRNARALPLRESSRVRCVNVSFSALLGGEVASTGWGRQDVIFAMGLFDYLPRRSASRLLDGLYSLLRPGGSVVIGNAAAGNAHFWAPELALRWSLLYRDEEEMGALTRTLPASARVRLEGEPAGAYHILVCEKP